MKRWREKSKGRCSIAEREKQDCLIVGSPDMTRLGHFDLGNLNWLGDQKSGCVAVLLCGSSASCPLLVTCHADAKEFPLYPMNLSQIFLEYNQPHCSVTFKHNLNSQLKTFGSRNFYCRKRWTGCSSAFYEEVLDCAEIFLSF